MSICNSVDCFVHQIIPLHTLKVPKVLSCYLKETEWKEGKLRQCGQHGAANHLVWLNC
jgi:hypothetical protein